MSSVRSSWWLRKLSCLRRRSEETPGLFGGSSGGCQTQHLLDVLRENKIRHSETVDWSDDSDSKWLRRHRRGHIFNPMQGNSLSDRFFFPVQLCVCVYLSDGHGAEDVEEDEGAVGVILAQQVAMWKSLDVWEGHERQFCHHSSIKAERGKSETEGVSSKAWGIFFVILEQTSWVLTLGHHCVNVSLIAFI